MTPMLKKLYKWAVPTGSRRHLAVQGAFVVARYRHAHSTQEYFAHLGRQARRLSLGTPAAYARWLARTGPSDAEIAAQPGRAEAFVQTPQISFLTPVYNPPLDVLRAMITSVRAQTYPYWQLCLVDGASTRAGVAEVLAECAAQDSRITVLRLSENLGISGNSNAALDAATGKYIALLDHDDLVSPALLFEVAATINHHPDADVVYFDEDKLTGDGTRRLDPNFKPPRFSRHSFLHDNYLMHSVLRRSLVVEAGGFDPATDGAQDWDLGFRVSESTRKIYHIPKILYHWRLTAGSTAQVATDAKPYYLKAQEAARANHLQRLGAAEGRAEPAAKP